jgi:hypothetical protein
VTAPRQVAGISADTSLVNALRGGMDEGITIAADPTNANLPILALRTTTLYSSWFANACRGCRDKFRDGDRVRLCPRCHAAYHDDDQYDLHCWQDYFRDGRICTLPGVDRFSDDSRQIPSCDYPRSDPELPPLSASALAPSLQAEWGDMHLPVPEPLLRQFVAGVEAVWRPHGERRPEKVRRGSHFVGRNCPWCRFRVRAGDWVVACPCECGTYFHQDVFRHMTCWNEWNGHAGHQYCPTTGRTFPAAPSAHV